jgi:nitrite reductase/ring-hydroxylating ferredoxin subunit
MYVEVGRLEDLAEGVATAMRVGGRQLLLTRWRGEVFATRATCPHQHASLEGGTVRHRLIGAGRVGEITMESDAPEITCPWHAWPYDLRSGQCRVDRRLRIRSYKVRLDAGVVLVDLG